MGAPVMPGSATEIKTTIVRPPVSTTTLPTFRSQVMDAINKLKTHPTFTNSTISPLTFYPTNNINLHSIHPEDNSEHFIKILGSRSKSADDKHDPVGGDPLKRLTSIKIGDSVRRLLKLHGPDVSIFHKDPYLHADLPALVVSKFDPDLLPLMKHEDDNILKKLDQKHLIDNDLFYKLGWEDQHLGNAAIKDGKLQLNDLEYMHNPHNPSNLYHTINNSFLNHYFLDNHNGIKLDKDILDKFVKNKDKIIKIFEEHLPIGYNKNERDAILKHVQKTLNLYERSYGKPLKDVYEEYERDLPVRDKYWRNVK